jgi:hypothetical protein
MPHRGSLDQFPLEMDEGMQWLRLYNDVLDDPKVQRLPPELFKHWINLLCLANQGTPRGRIPNQLEDLAFRLRLDDVTTARVLAKLQAVGLLDFIDDGNTIVPHDWDERQFASDDAGSYVRSWREKKKAEKDSDVILHVRPPDTDTESDTEQTRTESLAGSRQRYPAEFDEFWKAYGPTNGPKKPAFVAWQRLSKADRREAVAGLGKWLASDKWQAGFKDYPQKYLNQRFWENDPVPDQPRMNGHGVTKPEDRRPAIPTLEQVLQPPKQLSDAKRAELAQIFQARREGR